MAGRVFLSALIGAVVIFLQAGLFFGFLFADFFAGNFPAEFADVNRQAYNFPVLFTADILYASLLAFLFRLMDTRTFVRGAAFGALIGFVVTLHFDLIWAGTTYLVTPVRIAANAVISAFMSGVGGGVIAAMLGRAANRSFVDMR